jgi:hypothetical protein
MAEWLTHPKSYLRIASCTGSNTVRGELLFPGARKLYTFYSALVVSRNGLKNVFKNL